VEDDKVDVMTVKRSLEELDITNQLVQMNNGEEAYEYLKDEDSKEPCLILLDLNTPRMDGLEFLKVIKYDQKLKKIPVIVLTTSNNHCDIIESFELGAAGYMIKSVNYDRFVDTLRIINSYWTLSESPTESKKLCV
jgi:CheY-like chemotaxis protein